MEMKTFREKEKVACMPIYIFVCVTGGNDLHYINSSNAVRIVRYTVKAFGMFML